MAKIPGFVYALAILGIGGAGVAVMRSRPPQVDVVLPIKKQVIETIAASGRLRGQVETSVGARTSGRVESVPVREGDRVRAGQLLARIDDSLLRSQLSQTEVAVQTARTQVAQAEDAIATARGQLAVAARPPLGSDVTRLKADTNQSVLVAEARLAGAKQKLVFAKRRLAEQQKGPRIEEIEQAEASSQQAQATLSQAERDRDRQQSLARDGAVAQSLADQAETNYLVARRGFENAEARLKLLRAGTRAEQLEQSEADVRAAEATVSGARASGGAQLKSLLASPRIEDVSVARARLAEAERARAVAQARLAEAEQARAVAQQRRDDVVVTAPFDGTITQIVTEAGGLTGPNAPIVRLVRIATPEIRIDLDEANLGKLKLGQSAIVTSDAFPGERFDAKIREIGAQVDADRGTIEVRLVPINPPAWIRPGQTFSVNIIVDGGKERLIVPLTSVNTVGGVSTVLAVESGKVVTKPIRVGPPGPDGMPVLDGISADAQILTNPVGRKPDEAVSAIVKPTEAPKAK
jgi:HlyD family secretion protein